MKKSIWEESYNLLRKELRLIRKGAGLTQLQLAKKLEKNQSYVSKYEIGDRNLDYIEVIYVCKACNENPDKFTNLISQKIDKLAKL